MATDLREDVGKFAGRVLRRALWPHQIEAAKSTAFITVVAAARRTGKTVLAETLAIHTAFANRGCRVLILSATQDAARRLTESIGATLNGQRLTRGAVVDDFATRIRLTNGSQIVSLPASQRQVRGYGEGVLLTILDEAGFMPPELWTAAHYTALDERANGARILMLGTPWGGAEHFFRRAFRAGEDGDPDHAAFHWTHEANPQLDRAYLERQRDRVSPAEYAAEVLGEWSDAAGSLFPRALLERQTADVQLPEWAALKGPARLALGFDTGVSFDQSAAVAIGRLPVWQFNPDVEPRPILGVAGMQVWRPGAELSKVVDETANGTGARFGLVAPETNGAGAMPAQELRRLILARAQREDWGFFFRPVATSAPLKAYGYGVLSWLLEAGRLVLPRHPDLLRQLAGLRYETTDRGSTHIEAEHAATHDDLADALYLATGPRLHNGRATSWLRNCAQSPTWDAEVPDDLELVETGGGLRVPRVPWLQSVDGDELTGGGPVRQMEDVPTPSTVWANNVRPGVLAALGKETG